MEKLTWVYPIKAFTVINAVNKATPFVLECMVRKRLEKRLEVVLNNVPSYSSGRDRSALKLRSVNSALSSSSSPASNHPNMDHNSPEETTTTTNKKRERNQGENDDSSPESMVVLGGETTNMGSEFVHSIQFNQTNELTEYVKSSIVLRLVRVNRDKSTGLVKLVYDIILFPLKSYLYV